MPGWTAFSDETEAQDRRVLRAAPGEGLRLVIRDLVISNNAAEGNIVFIEDVEGTPVQVSPIYYLDAKANLPLHFKQPLYISPNKSFGFTSVGFTTHGVEVRGCTRLTYP